MVVHGIIRHRDALHCEASRCLIFTLMISTGHMLWASASWSKQRAEEVVWVVGGRLPPLSVGRLPLAPLGYAHLHSICLANRCAQCGAHLPWRCPGVSQSPKHDDGNLRGGFSGQRVGFASLRCTSGVLRERGGLGDKGWRRWIGSKVGFRGFADYILSLHLCTIVHIITFDELRMGSQQSQVKL
jgi:hypothetical protein